MDLNEQIAEMVFSLAEKHQKKVYAIVGNMSVVLARPDLLKKTECFICNEIEAGKLFGREELTGFSTQQMLDYYNQGKLNDTIVYEF